jgi:hypothetical protein
MAAQRGINLTERGSGGSIPSHSDHRVDAALWQIRAPEQDVSLRAEAANADCPLSYFGFVVSKVRAKWREDCRFNVHLMLHSRLECSFYINRIAQSVRCATDTQRQEKSAPMNAIPDEVWNRIKAIAPPSW